MADLADQLAEVIDAGLKSRPDLREALAGSLSDSKSTKAEANYREADSDECCGACSNFSESSAGRGSCSVVSGPINADYVSDLYVPAHVPASDSGDADAGGGGGAGNDEP